MVDDQERKLMDKAGSLLARRSYSRGELRTKLSKLADPTEVENVLDHLEAAKLLNDSDCAYNFASSRIGQDGWGPIRVRQSLLRRQIEPQLIEEAIDRVLRETDSKEVLRAYLARHCRKAGLPADRSGTQRLISHLRRRGFSDAIIYGTLREMLTDAAWEYLETGE